MPTSIPGITSFAWRPNLCLGAPVIPGISGSPLLGSQDPFWLVLVVFPERNFGWFRFSGIRFGWFWVGFNPAASIEEF
jgi:hypothetical protein